MTVGTVAQDRTIKLPVPDVAQSVEGAEGDASGNAALFGELLAQMLGGEAKDQDAADDTAPAGEQLTADIAALTDVPAPADPASPPVMPGQLQALLANALSTLNRDAKTDAQTS